MQFHPIEIPIATSMIELAEQAQHPFQKYFCFWAAFNNIYTLVAKRLIDNNEVPNDRLVASSIRRNAQIEFTDRPEDWGYRFPKVLLPIENKQIREAVRQLNVTVKDAIISHPNTRFFVDRIPQGAPGQQDSRGQLINGVLNITRTTESNFPVWSPINKQAYENFLTGELSDRDVLAEQIVFVLYTIRNNLVHGSKRTDDDNDIKVIEKASPLLEIVVRSFIWQ